MWWYPAVMAVAVCPSGRAMVVGVLELVLLPLPSWPSSLFPQQVTAPTFVSAQVWAFPAETDTAETSVLKETAVDGEFCESLFPLPCCPSALFPQQVTFPFSRVAHV